MVSCMTIAWPIVGEKKTNVTWTLLQVYKKNENQSSYFKGEIDI